MTIRELRKELKRKLNSLNLLGLDEIADYYTAEWVAFEELYREGTVRNFSNDFLANANHYQRYTREYENLSILQTLDLHSISATKKVARDMMAMFLNVDGWLHDRNRKREKETIESVEVAEETTAPEAEQTVEAAEQETELNTEIEAEQTEVEETAETETEEIEMRCVPYNYLGLKGYVSIEDKQIVNEDTS